MIPFYKKLEEAINKLDSELHVPQPGESSGKPLTNYTPHQTKLMSVDDIISTVKNVPYAGNVVDDYDAKDFSWPVTKKVIEYAKYLLKHQNSVGNLPPIIVVNGGLQDGAHRISAIHLLQQRLDKNNPLWSKKILKVDFVKQ